MKTLFKIAWIAGAAPIFVGTVIFIMWFIFRADIFIAAGMITIYAGLACGMREAAMARMTVSAQ